MEIKVLHIVHSLGMGGAETWLLRMIEYAQIQQQKIHFEIISTSGEQGVFDEDIKKLGVPIYYFPLKRGNTLSFIRRFRGLLKSNNYNVIHDHQDFLSGWHFLFGITCLPKYRITHVHNPAYQIYENYGISFSRKLKVLLGRFFIKYLSTHILGTSKQILTESGFDKIKFPFQKIEPLHCAFRISDWAGLHLLSKEKVVKEYSIPLNAVIVLFVGRFDYSLDINHPQNHKNSAFALHIFKEYHEKYNNNSFLIMLGENSYIKEEYQNLIDDYGLRGSVIMAGVKKEIKDYMLASSLLLFPSRAEGLGMVAVEAQSAGLPVLTSDAVPIECVVLNEKVNFCSLKSHVNYWSEKMNHIIINGRDDSTESDKRWASSEFNLVISYNLLYNIYKNGEKYA